MSEPKFECEICSDKEVVLVEDRGAAICQCVRQKTLRRAFSKIPPVFGVPRLEKITPRAELHPEQQAVLEQLRREPEASYLFCGKNGTGKTFFSYALYVKAVEAGRHCVAMPTRELIAEYRKVELGELDTLGFTYEPSVTIAELQKGVRWTIFLDEFDKVRVTPFTSEVLYAVLDAIWTNGHQLIVTTNLTVAELIERWGRIDEVYGNSIAKRLAASCIGIGLF